MSQGRVPKGVWMAPGCGEDGNLPYPILQPSVPLYEALEAPRMMCPLSEAAGRSASDYVNLYPPGIPLAVPGEFLTQELIARLEEYGRQGLNLQGVIKAEDGTPHLPVIA